MSTVAKVGDPHPIKCSKCGYDTGLTEEALSGIFLTESVICPSCGHIIISIATWSS